MIGNKGNEAKKPAAENADSNVKTDDNTNEGKAETKATADVKGATQTAPADISKAPETVVSTDEKGKDTTEKA